MLKAKIDTKTFSDVLDSMDALVTECRLHVTEAGVNSITTDAANVAMVKLVLPRESFSEFVATPTDLCVDIKKLKEATGKMGGKDIEITYTESSNSVELTDGKFKFKTRCLSDATVKKDPQRDPEDMQLPASFDVKGTEISGVMKATATVADKVSFDINAKDHVVTIASVDDSDEVMRADLKDGSDVNIIGSDSSHSMFSSDYLRNISRVFGKSAMVFVNNANDHPIRFKCELPKFYVVYVIAPRIETV